MSVVIVTIPGEAKRAFCANLHKRVGVDLVILQKKRPLPFLKRLLRLYQRVSIMKLPLELWYGFLLRLNGTRRKLEYFREYSPTSVTGELPRTLEVESVNSEIVFEEIRKISPDLLVIWGSAVLEPHILSAAKKSINLHMGYCPHYRGALANQYAVLRDDFSHIGATIHYASEKPDEGEIILTVPADISKPPLVMFRELNDKARDHFLNIAEQLAQGKAVPGTPQDLSVGETLLLKHWTPQQRFKVGRKIAVWEQKGFLDN